LAHKGKQEAWLTDSTEQGKVFANLEFHTHKGSSESERVNPKYMGLLSPLLNPNFMHTETSEQSPSERKSYT